MFRKSFKPIAKKPHTLKTSQGKIDFLLAKSSRRRTIAITIDEKASVQVYSPSFVPDKDVIAFIHEKAQWIFEKVREAQKNSSRLEQKWSFTDGSKFLFLGKKFPLRLKKTIGKRINLDFNGLEWNVKVPDTIGEKEKKTLIKKKMMEWYRQQALEILGGRIFHYSRIMGMEPQKIAIRTQKRIWGNCDYRTKTINLNWQIILSPIDVVDYVVVHELCHLKIPNHSKRFWQRVERFLPNYRQQKQWLKAHTVDMTLL